MTLQIRDDRARKLASKLAKARRITMTEAVIQSLEAELRREAEKQPLAERIARIAQLLATQAGPNRRAPGPDDIDALWGR
ncbi:type II toxin-antitoxin system VapB family antitoxin [Ancylobacter terrae]|uniref:type II toxin-antitoxin system VapB family antitoxin n=1 Tax=Ancylobacter sp. sgz301288 TaxID=3342077 RepID=UPI003858F228